MSYIHDADTDTRMCYGCDHNDCREHGCQMYEIKITDWSDFDPGVHRMPVCPTCKGRGCYDCLGPGYPL